MSVPRTYQDNPAPSTHRRYLGSGMFTCHRNYDLEAMVIATKRRLANLDLGARQG
jgi:hypothetical protein